MPSEAVFAPVAASGDAAEAEADSQPAEWEVQNIPGWTPAMTLEVEEVKSGQEEEEELFKRRAKLYRFCRATAEWKERALGEARILKHKKTEWVRFLMRMEKTEKISANHNIVTGKGKTLCCQLEPHMDSKKAFMWSAVDSAEDEPAQELFVLRFGKADDACEFQMIWTDALNDNDAKVEKLKPGPSPGPEAASAATRDDDK